MSNAFYCFLIISLNVTAITLIIAHYAGKAQEREINFEREKLILKQEEYSKWK